MCKFQVQFKKVVVSILFSVLFTSLTAQEKTSKVDHNHLDAGGYGYLIEENSVCSLWWAEGAYKVLQNAPVPEKEEKGIILCSAKNEWESFLVVVNPKIRLEKFRISVSALVSENGNKIDAEEVTIRKVEYVNVTHPTDSYSFKGKFPDPLPLYTQPETLYPSENQPFWVSLKVPGEAAAGQYSGIVTVSAGSWKSEIPVTLHVWNFALPAVPAMRSGFGLSLANIALYDNLHTKEQKQEAFDNYMKAFRDYKISPYNPFELTPIKEEVIGVPWQGGLFDSKEKHSGAYSYMVVDNSPVNNTECACRALVPVTHGDSYQLKWWAKSKEEKQSYVVGAECYDADKKLITFENRFDVFTGDSTWKEYRLDLGMFDPEIKFVKIKLYPSNRTITGEDRGTVWFDDITLTCGINENNLFVAGDFEVNADEIDIRLNFDDFNRAAKKYFNEYGFTGYRLTLKGLGGGTYYSRNGGVFEGFAQGTDEYNKLMQRYLMQIQTNLEQNGLLGKEYIYWFDEPGEADYPFVYETNAMIKKFAPKLTTFLTEHVAGQDISDVTDISCTIWHQLNHPKIQKMNAKGLEHWSYLCVWPKSPWISEFIDHDAINMRMWLWASYVYGLKGILIWESTYWNSPEASPEGYLQNPWDEAMSWVTGYGWIYGKQTIWGNGDGRLFYPLNRDPNKDKSTHLGAVIPSLRLETIRDGIEDYEYLVLLEGLIKKAPKSKAKYVAEAKELLRIPQFIYTDEKTYNKDPQVLLNYRKKLAESILKLSAK